MGKRKLYVLKLHVNITIYSELNQLIWKFVSIHIYAGHRGRSIPEYRTKKPLTETTPITVLSI